MPYVLSLKHLLESAAFVSFNVAFLSLLWSAIWMTILLVFVIGSKGDGGTHPRRLTIVGSYLIGQLLTGFGAIPLTFIGILRNALDPRYTRECVWGSELLGISIDTWLFVSFGFCVLALVAVLLALSVKIAFATDNCSVWTINDDQRQYAVTKHMLQAWGLLLIANATALVFHNVSVYWYLYVGACASSVL